MRDITAPLRGNSLHDGVAVRLLGLMFDGALGPGEFIDVRAVAAAWLFFRPHEYVLGAADAGVYVSLGASIAHERSIVIEDETLACLLYTSPSPRD